MAAIKKNDAVSRLTATIQSLGPDYLSDVYNELFPEGPSRPTEVAASLAKYQKLIFDYIDKGLEVEEILSLWGLLFPRDRRVQFDDETDEIIYRDESALYAD